MSFAVQRKEKFAKLKEVHAKPTPDDTVKISVQLQDETHSVAKNTQIYYLLPKKHSYIVALVDGEACDLSRPLTHDCKVEPLAFQDSRAQLVLFHSAAHVLGAVLEKMYEAHLGHGPSSENGFFYDAFIGSQIVPLDQLGAIETACQEFCRNAQKERDSRFEYLEITKDECLDLFSYNPLKCELIREHVEEGALCKVYRCGSFIDFCRGPHVPDLAAIGAFKMLNCSAAYFKGDQARESMQRVYGIAFPSKQELETYLHNLEEAKSRDHRVIAQQMDLFLMHKFAPGMPMLYNNGCQIYRKLESFVRELLHRYHYFEVLTPNFLNTETWVVSGHWEHYKDNMFLLEQKKDEPIYGLKPMNCPGHCLMFQSQHHTRGELPIRMSEFGVVHRREVSGALGGLTRVQRFEQDDAHIFCAENQIQAEIEGIMAFLTEAYKPFGLEFKFALSLRPEDRIGSDELWDNAENALRSALYLTGKEFVENPGDGAFYGPKIDVHLRDALGRFHQCGTVQLDFNMPRRFQLQFADMVDSKQAYSTPVMIHRAILGSIERFMAILIEHTAGRFPFWISPRQILIVPVRSEFDAYAGQIAEQIYQLGFECTADLSDEKFGKKLAKGFSDKYCFVCVVGQKEQEGGALTVQGRSIAAIDGVVENVQKYSRFMSVQDFVLLCQKCAAERTNV